MFIIGSTSLAWFTTTIQSPSFGMATGKLGDNTLEIAKIVHEDESLLVDETMRKYYLCENFKIEEDSRPAVSGDAYKITLGDMSFGVIDNVALLKADNVVYFRLTIPKNNGNIVKTKLYYGADESGRFFEMYRNIYDTDGEKVLGQEKIGEDLMLDETTSLLDAFSGVEGEAGDCFLKYSVLLSNEEIDADKLVDQTFYGADGKTVTEDEGVFYKFSDHSDSSQPIILTNEDYDAVTDNYYLYIRVAPNLSVFAYAIEYISTVMPCHVYFNVKAYFEVEGGV
jgi:hypothetical protein